MTNAEKLRALVARVEAEGAYGNRALDAEIWLYRIDPRNEYVSSTDDEFRYLDFERCPKRISWECISECTRSLDDAQGAAWCELPGWSHRIDATAPDDSVTCELFGPAGEHVTATAHTEALARCSALLRALLVLEEAGQG